MYATRVDSRVNFALAQVLEQMALAKKKPLEKISARLPARWQAENLSQTRREHAGELAEDYVEAIADLVAEAGEARIVDLAARIGVTHVTVNRTVARLQKKGFVTSQPYRAIFLTDRGRELAAACKGRHETVVAFLRSLGVSERIAQRDAEGIEHHVSHDTLAAFKNALSKRQR